MLQDVLQPFNMIYCFGELVVLQLIDIYMYINIYMIRYDILIYTCCVYHDEIYTVEIYNTEVTEVEGPTGGWLM